MSEGNIVRPQPAVDPRAAAGRARARAVRAGFLVGVLLGAVFIAMVLAPWAASVAMRRAKSWAAHQPPAATQPAPPGPKDHQAP
jgi:hypothetical protein